MRTSSTSFRPMVRISLVAALAMLWAITTQASGKTTPPTATAAKRVMLVEVGRLKESGEEGSSVIERGHATGTYDAPMTAVFQIRSKSVTAVVTVYPRGGSITGTAHATYKVVKSLGYFGGTFVLGRGTGKYKHASEIGGKPLQISGVINRKTLEAEVKAKGEANL